MRPGSATARHRQRQRRILIDGVRELGRAVAAGVRSREVFVCEPLCHSTESQRLAGRPAPDGAEILQVTEPVFEKLAFGQRAEGVLARGRHARSARWTTSRCRASRWWRCWKGVEKPGNVGAVLRSADGAGLSALVVADAADRSLQPQRHSGQPGHDLYHAGLPGRRPRRCSPGCGPQCFESWPRGWTASLPYTEADYRGPTAIVLGSEAAGSRRSGPPPTSGRAACRCSGRPTA